MRLLLWIGVLAASTACQVVTGLSDLQVDEDTTEDTETTDDAASGNSTDDTDMFTGSDAGGVNCTPPSDHECTPGNNCGCDSEETCALFENPTDAEGMELLCVNPGDKTSGDVCDAAEDCGTGLLCLNQVCVQACRVGSDCDQAGATCETYADANGDVIASVRYCSAPCDVLSPEQPRSGFIACEAEQTCVRTRRGPTCIQSAGAGQLGDSCSGFDECRPGFACSDGMCKQWCDIDEPRCAQSEAQCVPLGESIDTLDESAESDRQLGICTEPCAVPDVDGSSCGVFPNCGCDTGQTCRVVDADGRTACSPTGEVSAQGACESNADCESAYACVSGLCRPYCPPDVRTCSDDSICFPVLDDEERVEGVSACLGHCDPVNPSQDNDTYTPCGDGAYCAVGVDGTEIESAYCSSTVPADQRVGLGEYCDELTQCENGSLCAERCMPLCRTADDCENLTDEPACFSDFGEDLVLQASPGDEVGVCCTPTPTDGSACSTLGDTCGCPDGEACHVADVETGRTECFPEGNFGPQSACVYSEDCVRGLSCIGGLCRPLCEGEQCSPQQGRCFEAVYETVPGSEEFEPVPFSRACTGHCDPVELARDDEQFAPCGVGARCVPGHEGEPGFQESYCAVATADSEPGDACDFDQDCPDGYGCIGYTCLAWCRADEDCESGICDTEYYPRQVARDDWVGFCEPPLLPIEPL